MSSSITGNKDNSIPLSFQIAENSGKFSNKGKYLRPQKDSGIAEFFGHKKDHNLQSYVIPANKPTTNALAIGGVYYTLQQLADALSVSLPERTTQKTDQSFAGYLNHKLTTSLSELDDKYFTYFKDHGFKESKTLLQNLGVELTTIHADANKGYVFEKFHGKKAFLFPLPNGSFKYFILDEQFKVIEKLTNAAGTNCIYPTPSKDTKEALYIKEGFPDCLLAREDGLNTFTYSGGVQEVHKMASQFKVIPNREVYLCFDQDNAGRKAIPKALKAFIEEGHQTKVIFLPLTKSQGKDYCDYRLLHSFQDFQKLASQANTPHYLLEEEQTETKPLQLPEIEPIEACSLKELEMFISCISSENCFVFEAPTGIGKTYTLLKNMVHLEREQFTFFASTVAEVQKATVTLKTILEEYGRNTSEVCTIISDSSDENDSSNSIYGNPNSRIILTTYGYLGRKGHSAQGYQKSSFLFKDRILVLDEIQQLYKYLLVSHPLRERYLKKTLNDESVYSSSKGRCPKTTKKGNCSSCFPAYKRMLPDGRNSQRSFFEDIEESSFKQHSEQTEDLKEIFQNDKIQAWEDLLQPSNYQEVYRNLFFKTLPEDLDSALQLQETETKNHTDYLSHLRKSLLNPHLRIQFPLEKKSQEPILPSEIVSSLASSSVLFPSLACTVPHLCGLDLFAIKQLFSAKAMILTSATIPAKLVDVLKTVSSKKEWHFARRSVKDVPFTFDVTLLKTSKKLSIARQSKLIETFKKSRKEETLVITAKRNEATQLYNSLKKSIPLEISSFEHRDYYSERYKSPLKNSSHKHLISYSKSAISRGADFPEKNLLIVDCSQFIPLAGLDALKPSMNRQQKELLLAEEIYYNLTQIMGRVLRSLEKRSPGCTVQDKRKIVVLLHGLPPELSCFVIEPKLLHSYREFKETFVHQTDKFFVSSLVGSIIDCLENRVPTNYLEQFKEEITEKYKKGGNVKLTLEKRKTISNEDKRKIKLTEKCLKNKKKIEELYNQGLSKRLIQKKIHWYRISNTYPEVIQELGDFLDGFFK